MDNNINLEGRLYVAGTRGYSNYEIAVKNGFVGTEQEWLDSMVEEAALMVNDHIRQQIVDGTYRITLVSDYDEDSESLVLSNTIIMPIDDPL